MEDKPKNRDPYDGIKGPDTPLTPWKKFKRDFHEYIEGEKRFWKSMKEPFIRLGKVFGFLLACAIAIALVINQIEYELSIDNEQTVIEASSDEDKENEKDEEEEFIPKVETPVLDSSTLIGQKGKYYDGLEK